MYSSVFFFQVAYCLISDLTPEHRSQLGSDFAAGNLLILICTAAFEMGIVNLLVTLAF